MPKTFIVTLILMILPVAAADALPTVRVTGLHSTANWPREKFIPLADYAGVRELVFPADRVCVDKQISEAKGAEGVDEIHVYLQYGKGPDKSVSAELKAEARHKLGPMSWGKKRILELHATLPNVRENRNSSSCVAVSKKLIEAAMLKPGTVVGNVEIGIKNLIENLNHYPRRNIESERLDARSITQERKGKSPVRVNEGTPPVGNSSAGR